MPDVTAVVRRRLARPQPCPSELKKKIGGYPASTAAKENMGMAGPPPMKD
ncbi:hypothetical protein QJS04_geneDACA000573 [Acorus gramineus]|uniref:Uncharacterized protein n=1 Tax=Acorus gramineus TaxID=55184 RepID=A0AAV9APG7_ACOGR|nr:hypothetical protein QJS04_geneDACA000573 [Acorus gramineus]